MPAWPPFRRSAPGRRLYIHAGLHKTGTTALQDFLATQAPDLLEGGILYPATGRPDGSSGHHNLAWELMRDRRYRPDLGSLHDLADELRGHQGDVLISSEDFETQLGTPDWLARLCATPGLEAYQPVPILYLREQGAYFKSLFMELTKHGLTAEPRALATAVCAQGWFGLNEWVFWFDYHRIVNQLRRASGDRAIIRSYHHLTGGSVITDFTHHVLPGLLVGANAEAEQSTNAQGDLYEALSAFHMARLDVELSAAQLDVLQALAARCPDGGPPLSAALTGRLHAVFGHGNRRLGANMAFPPAPATTADECLEALFSFEVQCKLLETLAPELEPLTSPA